MNQTIDMVKLVEDFFTPAQKQMDKAKKNLADYFIEVEKKRDKKGHWQNCGKYASRCDRCKSMVYWSKEAFSEYEYCPRCGADMRCDDNE